MEIPILTFAWGFDELKLTLWTYRYLTACITSSPSTSHSSTSATRVKTSIMDRKAQTVRKYTCCARLEFGLLGISTPSS